MKKRSTFLKELSCCICKGYFKMICFFQLTQLCKFALFNLTKANTQNISIIETLYDS